jgi:hypothetical protein
VMVVVGDRALANRKAGVGGWAKTRNRAAVARLRARHVKRWRGTVRMGGTVVRTSDGGGGGGAVHLQNARRGGFGPKTRNRAPVARLRTGTGLQEVEGGTVGLQAPLPC